MNKQIESLNERYGAARFKLNDIEEYIERVYEEMCEVTKRHADVLEEWETLHQQRAEAMEELVGLARELASLTIGRD